MFCPKCGFQQATETTRFCSRCGLQLDLTAQLINNNGQLPVTQQTFPAVQQKPKPKGIKRGVLLLLLSVVLAPIFFALSVVNDSPAPLILPVTMFLGGLAWILYSYVFKDDFEPASKTFQPQLNQQQQWGLPGPQAYSVNNFHQNDLKTGELAPPASITEGTTTLFDKEERR